MQINKNEPSDLNAFIADLKKIGFEVEVKEGYIGFMMPDKDGKPTFMVSLPIDRYNFYPASNTIHNRYGKTFAVEIDKDSYKTIVNVDDAWQVLIVADYVEYY